MELFERADLAERADDLWWRLAHLEDDGVDAGTFARRLAELRALVALLEEAQRIHGGGQRTPTYDALLRFAREAMRVRADWEGADDELRGLLGGG